MKAIIIITLLVFGSVAQAEDLEVGKIYRLNKSIQTIKLAGTTTGDFTVAKESKFRVLDAPANKPYVIRFLSIYDFDRGGKNELKSTVREDSEYLLDRKVDDVSIEKSVVLSRGGAVSGPLIIPFKYRLDDDSLAGESTIGYYAGYSLEPRIPWTQVRIPVSPFIAGGLSQVSVLEDGETTNQSGITIAVGILIQNWAGVNIGLVYGQDRIGQNDWDHEGEDWISFMVGWEI